MKLRNLSIALILASAITSSAFAQDKPAKDFGKVNFGASIQEVKSIERNNKLTFSSDDELIYSQNSAGTNSQSMYSFDNGKLTGALNNIVTNHEKLTQYFTDFAQVDNYYKEIYGEPSQEIITTDDEAILNNPEKLCDAIKAGEVMCCTIWHKDKYTITHILSDKLPLDEMDEDVAQALLPSKMAHFILGEINQDE